jgi:hypothetical protein
MTAEPMAKRLSEHRFLHGLTQDQLALLTDCAAPAQFKADQIVFREEESESLLSDRKRQSRS